MDGRDAPVSCCLTHTRISRGSTSRRSTSLVAGGHLPGRTYSAGASSDELATGLTQRVLKDSKSDANYACVQTPPSSIGQFRRAFDRSNLRCLKRPAFSGPEFQRAKRMEYYLVELDERQLERLTGMVRDASVRPRKRGRRA